MINADELMDDLQSQVSFVDVRSTTIKALRLCDYLFANLTEAEFDPTVIQLALVRAPLPPIYAREDRGTGILTITQNHIVANSLTTFMRTYDHTARAFNRRIEDTDVTLVISSAGMKHSDQQIIASIYANLARKGVK